MRIMSGRSDEVTGGSITVESGAGAASTSGMIALRTSNAGTAWCIQKANFKLWYYKLREQRSSLCWDRHGNEWQGRVSLW